ncbi:MAG: type II toxin-antitoxin system VapC family toxin, partial [Leptolyngbya sp. SIO4C1]|nr:type II toxin-antitoxin system VapC family toxin [Leptolyngbya sp. SIO4C1]
MVIDSSAILAILRREEERYQFEDAILSSAARFISAGNAFEIGIVVETQEGMNARLDAEMLMMKLG